MNDLEDRLRDAFAARADLVTPESLRRATPPPPPVRRLPRWVVPGVGGLAVAATAAGVLVATAPAQLAAGPAPAPPAASATRPPAPVAPAPTGRTAPPSPQASATVAPTPSLSGPAQVPAALVKVVERTGWRLRTPSTWRATAGATTGAAEAACVGPAGQPCLVRLAAGLDASAPPDPAVLGGGLLRVGGSGCRLVGEGSELGDGADSAVLRSWRCGDEQYEQATLAARMLVAVVRTGTDPDAPTVLQSLRRDPGHVRTFVVASCPDIPFTERSEDLASDVRAGGVTCTEARRLVVALHARIGALEGPDRLRRDDYDCVVERSDVALPTATVTCRAPGGERVSYRQT